MEYCWCWLHFRVILALVLLSGSNGLAMARILNSPSNSGSWKFTCLWTLPGYLSPSLEPGGKLKEYPAVSAKSHLPEELGGWGQGMKGCQAGCRTRTFRLWWPLCLGNLGSQNVAPRCHRLSSRRRINVPFCKLTFQGDQWWVSYHVLLSRIFFLHHHTAFLIESFHCFSYYPYDRVLNVSTTDIWGQITFLEWGPSCAQ